MLAPLKHRRGAERDYISIYVALGDVADKRRERPVRANYPPETAPDVISTMTSNATSLRP